MLSLTDDQINGTDPCQPELRGLWPQLDLFLQSYFPDPGSEDHGMQWRAEWRSCCGGAIRDETVPLKQANLAIAGSLVVQKSWVHNS